MPYSKGTQKGTLILTTTQIEREREGERTREREGEREREVSRSSFGLDRALTQEHLGRKGFGKRHKLPVKLSKIAQDQKTLISASASVLTTIAKSEFL